MHFKGWFGPETVGFGMAPRSWQGWLATGLFVLVEVALAYYLRHARPDLPYWSRKSLMAVPAVIFIVFAFLTYSND